MGQVQGTCAWYSELLYYTFLPTDLLVSSVPLFRTANQITFLYYFVQRTRSQDSTWSVAACEETYTWKEVKMGIEVVIYGLKFLTSCHSKLQFTRSAWSMWFIFVKKSSSKPDKRRRQWHPTPVFLPRKSYGWRSLESCSPWGHWGLDTTGWLHFHFSLSCIGEGNGNPLQCSCLENPRDGGAWWGAVYGVTQSQTQLKRLSSSSSSSKPDKVLNSSASQSINQ